MPWRRLCCYPRVENQDTTHRTYSCSPHFHSPRLTGESSARLDALQSLSSCTKHSNGKSEGLMQCRRADVIHSSSPQTSKSAVKTNQGRFKCPSLAHVAIWRQTLVRLSLMVWASVLHQAHQDNGTVRNHGNTGISSGMPTETTYIRLDSESLVIFDGTLKSQESNLMRYNFLMCSTRPTC